jgi:hypothetical protein
MPETNLNVVERTKKRFRDNYERIEKGGINCIPSPFSVFKNDFPGVEKGKYYLVSGAAKSAKTQISNLLFLYNPLLYAYYHRDQIKVKVLYFPLEETDEKITARFISYLLYKLSNKKIRKSAMELNSINSQIDMSVLDMIDTQTYDDILQFYLQSVEFVMPKNPTGCWRKVLDYANEHGTIHRKWDDRLKRNVFDWYEPNDPDEYVIIIWDHAGLTHTETEAETGRALNLKESIDKLSEYFIFFRDKLQYTPVLIQQQNMDTISLDAFKQKKIMPTLAGLADTKNTGKDCSLFLGITNPHAFEIEEYRGYNTRELGGWCRFLEVVMNREGESNGYLPLYFDGAVNFFHPMPKPNDYSALQNVYEAIRKNGIINA